MLGRAFPKRPAGPAKHLQPSHRAVRRRPLLACALLGCLVAPAARGEEAGTVSAAQIAAGIRESHRRLFQVPGGVGVRYRLDVEQDPRNPVFIWESGLDGILNVKWPVLRCRVEGPMSGYSVYKGGKFVEETRPSVREANYNFETMASVGHDSNMLGQIANYRHAFSAIMGFPLLMQFYAEMDQYYVPGEALKTEYWLPNALEQQPYELAGPEDVGGIPCQVLRRSGLDTLWVATAHGHVICKREYHYGVGKPLRERVQNLDLKEVSPGVWLPLRQIKEEFDADQAGKLRVRYTLKVLETKVGNLTNGDVDVVLDEKIAKIENHISKKFYEPSAGTGHPFDDAVQRAREINPRLTASNGKVRIALLLVSINVALGIALFWLYRKPRPAGETGAAG
ncbi:MAG TPA: hypothetical protein VFE78_05915 [Gemmataceae bacterium]|nr:hypothetical protein [Gemmataceae bacterium]